MAIVYVRDCQYQQDLIEQKHLVHIGAILSRDTADARVISLYGISQRLKYGNSRRYDIVCRAGILPKSNRMHALMTGTLQRQHQVAPEDA